MITTKHTCSICGTKKDNLIDFSEACNQGKQGNRYKVGDKVRFLHNSEIPYLEFNGEITGITFRHDTHIIFYNILVRASENPERNMKNNFTTTHGFGTPESWIIEEKVAA